MIILLYWSCKKNRGVNSITLYSHYSATQSTDYIALEFSMRITAKIMNKKKKISEIIDKSTILSRLSTLIS
jgi:hypothetical protein